MDNDLLLKQLSNTLSPENSVRNESEHFLLSADPQIVPQLLSLLVEANVNIPFELELVALTLIKNRIVRDWNPECTELNKTIKKLITDCLIKYDDPFQNSNYSLIKMCLIIMDLILLSDKSNFQNELLQFSHDQITYDLKFGSADTETLKKRFYIGTLIIKQITKRNRNVYVEGMMSSIVSSFMPYFANYLKSYYSNISTGSQDLNDAKITYEILKTMNYMVTRSIPEGLQNYDELTSSCQLIAHILLIEFTHFKNYRISKWIFRFFIKLQILQLSFDSILVSDSNDSIISNLLATIGNVLNDEDTEHVKSRCIYFFVTFLTRLISNDSYHYIEPNLNTIISQIILKLLSLNETQIESFETDAVEFINLNISSNLSSLNSSSSYQDMFTSNLNSAATSFLHKLIKQKEENILPLVSLANDILSSNITHSIPCALTILKSTQKKINRSQFNESLSKLAEINSTLSNNNLWLRCLIYEFFSNIETNFNPIEQFNLPLSLDLNQPLPLLVTTLKLIISKSNQSNINAIQLMQILLTIGDNESLEIIVDLIDKLVEDCPHQLGPYSVELITNLSASFNKVFEENDNARGDDENKEDKLLGILNNILTILMSCNNDKEIVSKLNEQLSTTISLVLENGLLDFVESILELVSEINLISEKVLNLDVVIESFKNYGFNYFDYYNLYFLSVYTFGDFQQRTELNQLVNWILVENPAGFDNDDFEFSIFISSLIYEMVIASDPSEDDHGLSNELYSKMFENIYGMYDDKDEFWNEKLNYRFILGGVYKKPSLVISILGDDNIEELLIRFRNFIQNNGCKTLNDLKLGILAMMEIVKVYCANDKIKSMAMNIFFVLCDAVNPAIEHREKLLKLSTDAFQENDGVEFEMDDEYDELTKKSVLDKLDVFGILKTFLEKYHN